MSKDDHNPILALKIDVDTLHGTKEGIPHLIELLHKYQADATFLLSLGKDYTGRAITRILRPGFIKKVTRTSVLQHYGLKTLLYGTLLPGPHIAKHCSHIMQKLAASGFEVGMHAYNHVQWQDHVADANEAWTEQQMRAGIAIFEEIFGYKPKVHGAPGWQMNRYAYCLEQQLGFLYASDTRGTHPFLPIWRGERIGCIQLPTTLPTLDELIGCEGLTSANAHSHLLKLTALPKKMGHVYTLHAELEGMKLLPVFENLIKGWKDQGYRLVSLATLYDEIPVENLPYHEVVLGSIPGRSGVLALQGPEF